MLKLTPSVCGVASGLISTTRASTGANATSPAAGRTGGSGSGHWPKCARANSLQTTPHRAAHIQYRLSIEVGPALCVPAQAGACVNVCGVAQAKQRGANKLPCKCNTSAAPCFAGGTAISGVSAKQHDGLSNGSHVVNASALKHRNSVVTLHLARNSVERERARGVTVHQRCHP